MAGRRILFDKTELLLKVTGKKKVEVVNLTADQIRSIRFSTCDKFRFFRKVPSEQIIITSNKRSEPIVYTRIKGEEVF